MASKLFNLAMAQVLKEVPEHMHRLPDATRNKLTSFYFEECFERDAERAQNLADYLAESFSDEIGADRMKKLMSTFTNIDFQFYTPVDEDKEEDLQDASAGLIYNVGDFLYLLDDASLERFLKFLEGLVITFHDPTFRLLDQEHYDLEVRVHFLKASVVHLI